MNILKTIEFYTINCMVCEFYVKLLWKTNKYNAKAINNNTVFSANDQTELNSSKGHFGAWLAY